jgi:hypothetical protein
MHGDRVGGERSALAKVRLGVGVIGRPDVAALDVEDDELPSVAGAFDQPAEGTDTAPAVPLEERRLRLDQPDSPRGSRERDVSEPVKPVRAVAEAPRFKQAGGWVQAEDERAPGLPDCCELAGEGLRHGCIFARLGTGPPA